jgi:hypothetical protein
MNCPSRNDDVLMNPGWNQNPPRFAADLTTCADMNGIANARELGDADCLCSGTRGLRHCEVEDNNFEAREKRPPAVGKGVKGSSRGRGSYRVIHGTQANATTGSCTQPTTPLSNEQATGQFKSWGTWLSSVLATSVLISFINGNMSTMRFASSKTPSAAFEAVNALKLRHNLLGSADTIQMIPLLTTSPDGTDVKLALHNLTTTLHSMSAVCSSSCSYRQQAVLFPSSSPSFRAFASHRPSSSVPSISALAS